MNGCADVDPCDKAAVSTIGFNVGVKTPVGPRELSHRDAELRQWIGRQINELRVEAGVSQPALAACAGLSQSYIWKIEAGLARPGLETLQGISACLGCDLSVRLFPNAGPRLHDRFQAPMIDTLIRCVGRDWRPRPEVAVPAARGVIDLVLSRTTDHLSVVCECHSELRRLELVIRRLAEKADAFQALPESTGSVSRMLLLRSTAATRSVANGYEATLAAAFPGRPSDAIAALRTDAAWPGPAIIWALVEGGRAEILDRPPRGVRLGR